MNVRSSQHCVRCKGGLTSSGYGYETLDGVRMVAHRAAWIKQFGPIPSGLLVCHHCDNKSCINTAHLFLGTQSDNIKDAFSKGRLDAVIGAAKLTQDQVNEIRLLRGKISSVVLGSRMGVEPSTIRKAWTNASHKSFRQLHT